jgi:hypothetical protein
MKTKLEPIATIQHFPTVVYIFECDDETVIASIGSAWTDSPTCVENAKPRTYKMYYSTRRDSYYFRIYGCRYYLDEALRTNL